MSRFFASRRRIALSALLCLAVMLVSVNVIAARFATARLDLTADHLYTLSGGTLRTLKRIDEPITLRFYYSRRLGDALPVYGVYAAHVREMLDQYVAAAHGKLRLRIYDPQPFSTLEDRAVAYGLQAAPLDSQGDHVYFGLVGTNSTDDRQVIPFFARERERFLEYDLTRLIHSLAVPQRTVVGLITSLPLAGNPMAMMQGRPSVPTAVLRELRESYKVKPLDSTLSAIPSDVDVLMLAQPPKLPPKTLYAIDQFVLKGGKALVFADPDPELQAAPHGGAGGGVVANLQPLFKAWGVRMPAGIVAGDRRHAQMVSVPSLDEGQRPLRYVAWLDLRAADMNRHDMITADLSHLTMASAGIIEPLKGRTTTVEPLITTSRDAEKIPVAKLAGMPDVEGLLADFKPTDKRYILAARITGMAKTAFPDGPPKPPAAKAAAAGAPPAQPPAKPAAPAQKPLARSLRPINVVLVADSDMLGDRFWAHSEDFFGRQVVVPFANNGDFVADAIEVLGGGADLIGLRSRGTSARPFTLVDRIRRRAQARYSAKEHALEQNLKATETKIAALTGTGGAMTPATLSPQEAKAIAKFRLALLETRRQLRGVQAALRGSIERLKTTLEFIDIALVPILVALIAIIVGIVRLRRRARRSPIEIPARPKDPGAREAGAEA